jgi:flagellar biosynthesis protein FlhG
VADQADKLRMLAAEMRNRPSSTGSGQGPGKAGKAEVKNDLPYSAPPRARIVAISSGKGGVGKSNLSINLALSLCQLGRQVILFDADLGLANADVLLGLQPRYNLTHFFQGGRSLQEIMVEGPLGLKVIPSGSGISQLADLGVQDRERVLSHFALIEDQADFLLVDTGAGISRNVTSFARAADEVIVVTTPEPTARLDAYGLIKVLASEGYDGRMQVVVNMAESAAEGEEVGRLMETLASRFLNAHVQMLGSIPRDRAVQKSVRAQKPFLLEYPDSPAARAVLAIASRLSQVHLAPDKQTGMQAFLERLSGLLKR